MTKPQWLKDKEHEKNRPNPITCGTCVYIGKVVGFTKWKNKERCELFECEIHPSCFNTVHSIKCSDHTPTVL